MRQHYIMTILTHLFIIKSLTLKAVLELDLCDTPNETFDIDKYIDIMTSFVKTQFVQFVLCMTYLS